MEEKKEMVNHPEHYNHSYMECIDGMLGAFGDKEVRTFCKISAFKYLWRLGYKDDEAQEIGKIKWYLDKYLELKEDDLPNFKYNELGEVVTDYEGNVVMEEHEYPHGETLAEAIERKEAEFYTALMKQGLSRRQIDNLLGKCD